MVTSFIVIKDLRGFKCPMNYVHTRLTLSDMAPGDELEVWVDRGEPEESLPRSLKRDGFEVVSVQALKDESGVAVTVRNIVATLTDFGQPKR